MIIVTGASGHLGNVLVRYLLSLGKDVGVIDRDPENDEAFKDIDVPMFKGDVRDKEFLLKTFNQAEYVFHLAGIVAISPGKKDLMYSVNIEGTRTVVEACIEANVKRLVYTSSVHALFEPPVGQQVVEELADVDEVIGDYARTKVMGTKEVLKGIERGLDTVITYPSGVIGPYDFKGSEMGKVILDYINGKYKTYIDGAYNFVDVRDIARGLVAALEKGKAGEDYILAGNKISVLDLFNLLSELTDIQKPKIRIPMWLAKMAAPFAVMYYAITKETPIFTPYALDVLRSNSDISSEKAKRELGYSYRDVKSTIADIIKWRDGKKVEV